MSLTISGNVESTIVSIPEGNRLIVPFKVFVACIVCKPKVKYFESSGLKVKLKSLRSNREASYPPSVRLASVLFAR